MSPYKIIQLFRFHCFFFVFLQKFSNFSSNLFEKRFENGQRLHLSIELFMSCFVDDIVLYKTMFIHVSSFGEFSHFYRFSKKNFSLSLVLRIFFLFSKTKLIILNFYFIHKKYLISFAKSKQINQIN